MSRQPEMPSDGAIQMTIDILRCGWTLANVKATSPHNDSYHNAILSFAAFIDHVDAVAKLADAELVVDGLERAPHTSDATARRALQSLMINPPAPKLGKGFITTSGGQLDVDALVSLLKRKGILDA